MRKMRYRRHEFRHEPVEQTGTLLTFVYDIPSFAACGVFPPLHILNQVLESGGGDGGMSPGTSWEPFAISPEEYEELFRAVLTTPISQIAPYSRYASVGLKFDPEFDSTPTGSHGPEQCAPKHRDEW
jgi:hypothetical protein